MADILSTDEGIPSPQMGGTQGGAANALAAREARKNTKYEEFFAAKAKNLVKGVGHVSNNGVPLSDVSHGGEIMTRSHDTIMKTRAATIDGAWNTDDVVGGISQDFWGHPKRRRDEVHGQPGLDGAEELHRNQPGAFGHPVRPRALRSPRAVEAHLSRRVTMRLRRVTSVDHCTARGTPPNPGESRSPSMPEGA